MARLGQDIHNDNPGEELNYHGLINSTEPNEQEGKNHGYPVCYAVWETSTVTGADNVRVGVSWTMTLKYHRLTRISITNPN